MSRRPGRGERTHFADVDRDRDRRVVVVACSTSGSWHEQECVEAPGRSLWQQYSPSDRGIRLEPCLDQVVTAVERSNVELIQFSRRLLHGVQLYFRLSRTLTRIRLGFDAEPPWEISSAQVESFAIHTRGLADFFYVLKRGRYGDDAFAFDFFDSPEAWRTMVGEPGAWLRRVQFKPEKGSPEARVDRFGKQIAHLNYDVPPVSDFARGWPVMQLSGEVGTALARFTLAVDHRKVARGFKTKVWREGPALSKLNDPTLPPAVWTRPSLRLPSA